MSAPNSSSVSPSPIVGEGRGEGAFKKFWRALRTLVGDDAYEQYCTHHQAHHSDQPLLDRRAFYVKNQTDKWSGIKRCC
jgi:uncharacterized short protein YbdD (DUF466 family)